MMTNTRRHALLFAVLAGVALVLMLAAQPLPAQPRIWKMSGWEKTDFSKSSIALDEILSGGVPKDGIPSISDPRFAAQRDVADLGAREPVITLEINGDARAYPLRILIWHEIVNDTVGGVPVAVTYCPLCNSAIVFERRIGGKLLDFGTTGKLRFSNLVMYDRQTQSWWQQFTGDAIIGAMTGTTLKMIPARLEAFELFRQRYPQGRVQVPPSPARRPYGKNPYVGYDSLGRPLSFFTGPFPEGINPMARVIVLKTEGKPLAVSMAVLGPGKSYQLGDIRFDWQAGQNSALDTGRIDQGRDVGNIVVTRKTAKGEEDVTYDVTFAFVFHAFYPDRKIIQ